MTAGAIFPRVVVVSGRGNPALGTLVAGTIHAPCALGRSGTKQSKHEGDGATPAGSFGLVAVLYRPDRGPRPLTRRFAHNEAAPGEGASKRIAACVSWSAS